MAQLRIPCFFDEVVKRGNIKWQDHNIFFASTGHSNLTDYRIRKVSQALTANMCDAADIIGAVCHGGATFPSIIDPKTGKSIIAGKKGNHGHPP
jgi:putative intracellular protease/amidase